MASVITSKMAGKCGICGKEYPAGTRIAKDNKTGKWAMADCIWPKIEDDANPRDQPSQGGSEGRRAPPPPIEAAPFLESSLDIALGVVRNAVLADYAVQTTKPSNEYLLKTYPRIINELLREQEAIALSQRIQEGKERNIQLIGRR
jgi:hypothetical protein